MFGGAEILGSVYLCGQSAGVACTTASLALAAHGADTSIAGARALITGEGALPVGTQLLMRTGLSETQASLAYDLMVVGFELNAVRAIARQGDNALRQTHEAFWDRVEEARFRQEQMLASDTGYNVSPAAWDNYPTIGRDGTYLTDEAAITDILGPINSGGETVISATQASQLELAMGLQRGSLSDGFKIRRVTGINAMSPRSPTVGNEYFLGAGQHLPGGGPEMVVNAIPTVDSQGVTTITSVVIR